MTEEEHQTYLYYAWLYRMGMYETLELLGAPDQTAIVVDNIIYRIRKSFKIPQHLLGS